MKDLAIIEGVMTVSAQYFQASESKTVEDALVEEGPLQIVLNGAPFSVTMRTPGEDALLAQGLLFTEGILKRFAQVRACKVIASEEGRAAEVQIELAAEQIFEKEGNPKKVGAGRRLISNASCGVCGITSSEDLQKPIVRKHEHRMDMEMLPTLAAKMRGAQLIFQMTGGSHAAAMFDIAGEMLVIKEDVGRHNAVDKAIGYLLEKGLMGDAAILFVSGRVSYEIVTKASRAGVAFLVAVSAPSTLAVSLCIEAGITLIGFCRGQKATVYSHSDAVNMGKLS